jgi:Uma2 family endonuclease
MTAEEFLGLPDDGLRKELFDGEVVVAPAPSTRHQEIVICLVQVIKNHIDAHGGGRVLVAPYDVVLSAKDVVEPDVLFVADERNEIITKANARGAPTLVIEVVSDPATDRRRKRDLYARAGIPEYWIVDPDGDRVEVYRLPGRARRYPKPEILEPGDSLTSGHLPALVIDVAGLLAR